MGEYQTPKLELSKWEDGSSIRSDTLQAYHNVDWGVEGGGGIYFIKFINCTLD